MSPDLTTIKAEFILTRLGLSADMAGSCQGMTRDRTDGSLWRVVKLSGASGTDSYLVRFDPAIGTVPTPSVPLSAGADGIAWDPVADCLWMLRDTGELIACDRSGALRSGPMPLPANCDQCMIATAVHGESCPASCCHGWPERCMSGTVHRYRRLDYGRLALVAVDTLNGAHAIEGIWIDDTGIRVGNDAATHSGSPPLNRIGRHGADSHA